MNLCDSGHDEICYDSKNCPLCEAQEIMQEHEEKIKELEEDLKTCAKDIELMEEKLNEYEEIHKEIKIHYPEFCI